MLNRQALASTANDEKWNTPTSVFNLEASMTSHFTQLLQMLQDPLNHFSGNYHNACENLLDERIAIGHGLIGSANAASHWLSTISSKPLTAGWRTRNNVFVISIKILSATTESPPWPESDARHYGK